MTEEPISHEIAKGVLVAALLAAASVFPPAIGVVVTEVGVEVLGGLTERNLDRIRDRFLGSQELLDGELQTAMRRAYVQAINQLEQLWWETPAGRQTKRGVRDE